MKPRIPASCKVYTPPALAEAIVKSLGDLPNDSWLEPCSGKGAFLLALSHLGVPRERITAVDLECRPEPVDKLARTERGTEFLSWSLKTNQRFSKIVANPPFVSFRRISSSLRLTAERLNCHWAGPTTGNSNLWFAFLRSSLSLLKPDGSMAFVVPAAYEYADYAAVLRSEIYKHFRSFETHRCHIPLFPDVQDGCIVLLGRGYDRENAVHKRFEYETRQQLIQQLGTRRPQPRQTELIAHDLTHHVKISDVFDVKIGCVTGDVKYFLLRESDRRRWKLPIRALKPALTRASHLREAFSTRQTWKKLRDLDERVWLFRPTQSQLNHPSVRRYLRRTLDSGGCNKAAYKIGLRSKWYCPDLPDQIHGFISGTSGQGPWISLQMFQPLTATNTLYCVTFKRRMSGREAAAWSLSLLTSDFRHQYNAKLRKYADGLMKIEPGDLASLSIRKPPVDCRKARATYRAAINALVKEGRSAAEKIAEAWLRAPRG